MLISFIIPAYNAEAYIDDCLKSIFENKVSEDTFEIVIINDGSKDNTLQKIDNWSKIHFNIKCLSQPNSGVSISRNNAIKAASGRYLTFLDADDWITNNCLSQIMNELIHNPFIDLLITNMENVDTQKRSYSWQSQFNESKNYTTQELCNKNFFRGSSCAVFYKKEFLDNYKIRFPEGIGLAEDTIFFSQCVTYEGLFRFLDIPFYMIRQSPNSVSRTNSIKKVLGTRDAAIYTHDVLLKNAKSKQQKSVFNRLKYQLISNALYIAIDNNMSYMDLKKIFDIDKYLPINLDGISKQKNKMRLLNWSNKLFYIFQAIKKKRSIFHGT